MQHKMAISKVHQNKPSKARARSTMTVVWPIRQRAVVRAAAHPIQIQLMRHRRDIGGCSPSNEEPNGFGSLWVFH
jgi:hypothetical protein